MKRIVSLILAIIMILAVLVSCNGGSSQNNDETTVTNETAETTEADTTAEDEFPSISEITLEDLPKYTIVRSEFAVNDVKTAFTGLNNAIKDTCGVYLIPKEDFFREGIPSLAKGEFEILVGDTNREESEIFLKSLSRDDYGYRIVGKKLVIAGHTPAATCLAVEKFINDVLPGVSGNVFFSNDKAELIKHDYPVSSLSLNGTHVTEYKIVYPVTGSNSEKIVAERVRDLIADTAGSYIKLSDDRNERGDVYEIIIGNSSHLPESLKSALPSGLGADEYYISGGDKTIWIYAADTPGLIAAANAFGKIISEKSGDNGKVDCMISDGISATYISDELTVMSFNILVSQMSPSRTERVCQMVKTYMPDTIGFQEVSPTWINALVAGIGDCYDYVGLGRDGEHNGEHTPVFYLKSKFRVIETKTEWMSATPEIVSKYPESSLNRVFTYALLERIHDGKRFVHINTHLEHTSAEARDKQILVLLDRIKHLKEYPIVMTGDFNAESNTNVYKLVIGDGFTDAAFGSKSAVRERTFRGSSNTSNKVIDFIFFTNGNIIAEKYKVCSEQINGDYPSDHNPIILKYLIAK